MISVTRNGTDRIDAVPNGKLNAESMKTALEDLLDKSENIQHGKMLFYLEGFDLPSLGAVELSRLPAEFRFVRRFNRFAVLSDKAWINKISEIEGHLIPCLEIKGFNLDQKSEAEDWLSTG